MFFTIISIHICSDPGTHPSVEKEQSETKTFTFTSLRRSQSRKRVVGPSPGSCEFRIKRKETGRLFRKEAKLSQILCLEVKSKLKNNICVSIIVIFIHNAGACFSLSFSLSLSYASSPAPFVQPPPPNSLFLCKFFTFVHYTFSTLSYPSACRITILLDKDIQSKPANKNPPGISAI